MSCLKMIGCDLQRGRKLAARKGRKGEVYAGNTAPDSGLAQIDVNITLTTSDSLGKSKYTQVMFPRLVWTV